MDDIVLYNLLTLTTLRLIVSAVYLEHYTRRKDDKSLYLTISWLCFSLSPLTWLLSNFTENFISDFLFITSGSFAASSTMAIFIFLLFYFEEYNVDYKIFGLLISIFFANYVFLILDLVQLSVFWTVIVQNIPIGIFFLYIIIKHETIKNIAGTAVFWIYLITFFSIIQVLSTIVLGSLTEEIRVITILNTFLLAQALQSIEHNISTRTKYLLKDKYSHDITNMLQTVEMVNSLTLEKEELSDFTKKKIRLVQKEIEHSADLLKKIREI